MKITMYELLGMVKDGKLEDGTKFKYNDNYFKYWKKSNSFDRYEDKTYTTVQYYNDDLYDLTMLNDTVEILEEEKKIPEKLEDISEIKCVGCKVEINIAGNTTLFDTDTPIVTEHCIYKINQLIKNQKKIIDYLKSKGE